MADVTTHGNTVRADRMELLTVADRVPERLRRLENSLTSAQVQQLDIWHLVGTAGEPGFQNGWVNYAGTYPSTGFRKDPFGRVFLKGLIAGGTVGATAFTLPVGYRPPKYLHLSTTALDAAATVRIDTVGNVNLSPTNAWMALDSVSFDTETVSTYLPGGPGSSGPTGVKGDPGPKGDKGDTGATGPGGTVEYYAQPGQPTAINNGAIWIDTDEAPAAGGSSGQRISGAEHTANSGSLATGVESDEILVSHSLGIAPSIVFGHLEDGSWAHQCGWRVSIKSATQIGIRFRNNGPNTATAILRFKLIY